jgi:hypothetical protein
MVRRLAALGLLAWGLLASSCGPAGPKPRALPAGVSFAGTWDSTWGKMVLTQEGSKVHGHFTGYREGGVSGQLEGDVYRFVWDQLKPRGHGRGYLQISPDGNHLEGRWGYGKKADDGGRWAADRDLYN